MDELLSIHIKYKKEVKNKIENSNIRKFKANILFIFLIIELKISKKIYNIYNYEHLLDDILQKKRIFYSTKRIFLYKDDIIEKNNKKNIIHISMAIDNNGLYPTLVSMVSALHNNNQTKNILVYHLLLSYNFNKNYITTFDSLKSKYEVKINYYIIPNIFKKYRSWNEGTTTIYYKLLLPFIMNEFERIIYLDADTLVFKDIFDMYNLPFNGNYALGYPFHDVYKIDKFIKNVKYYINGGVILFNLKKIRNDNKDIDFSRARFFEYNIF